MASNSVDVGSAGRLTITANVLASDVAGNRTYIHIEALFSERVSHGQIFGLNPSASVVTPGGGLWSGSFTFDWRPAGLQTTLIYAADLWFNNRADGTGDNIFRVDMGSTGTSGAGGPANVEVYLAYPTNKVPPGTPSSLGASRVSDTQVNLSWAQSSASHGQPQTNDIEQSVNDSAFGNLVTINATTSASIGAAPNQKLVYRVRAWNSAGASGWSGSSAPVYTTPGTPSGASATKNTALNIVVGFTSGVAYSEHEHEIQHGVVSGGVTTWDSGILATLAAGTASYTHTAPNSGQVHVYQVRSKAAGLYSPWVQTNSVQLLAPPNKPTIPALPVFVDRAKDFYFPWVHNPVDTSPQTHFEWSFSQNGGSSWPDISGKVAGSNSQVLIPANFFVANTTLLLRVRTWGSATTGGSEGTGASPWSDPVTITFKSAPAVTITAPANGASLNDATLRVNLSFAQAQAAAFVKAQLELWQGATLVETRETGQLIGTTLNTRLQNGASYTIKARVQDSNGLWSSWAENTFSVSYLAPVAPSATVSFLPDSGFGQLDITIPAPGAGQAAADTITITRTIDGVSETIMQDYPVNAEMTIFDTTPTVHGVNTYTITTKSALGAQTSIVRVLETAECRRAYLSKGAGFGTVVTFGGNLSVDEALSVASDTVSAAGRLKPIGLYGIETAVQLKVKSFLFESFGSSIDQVRSLLLMPGKACYRDPSGRRVFGSVKGSVSYKKVERADLSFTITETS